MGVGIAAMAAVVAAGRAAAAPPAAGIVGYLEYFHRWDSPLDDRAHETFVELLKRAPDFEAFRKAAPPGSEQRRLFDRFLANFEDAAALVRAGKMNEDLYFNAWYSTARIWKQLAPYMAGLRQEAKNPRLYAGFEWLAAREAAF